MTFIESFIKNNTNLKSDDILNLYWYGSRIYGTYNESSDSDFICVCRFIPQIGNCLNDATEKINIKFYTVHDFQLALDNQEITALECYFLPDTFISKNIHKFNYNVNLGMLRTSISTITSNSYVKAKKKITILGDYDLNAGLKSLFHSLRILDLGIQIATNEKIVDYSRMNYVLWTLKDMSVNYSYDTLWTMINNKYLSVYKKLKHDFKQLCPKENIDHFKEQENLRNIFSKYKIHHPQLIQIIKEILNEIK